MIELVKTPGRKKGFLKQPKVVSKLNHSMSSQSVSVQWFYSTVPRFTLENLGRTRPSFSSG